MPVYQMQRLSSRVISTRMPALAPFPTRPNRPVPALATTRSTIAPVKSLLYAGVVGPLLFIAVFFLEGFTRPGYSQSRNFVSQLATGDGGWMQVVNFYVCGALVLLFAVGLRQALKGTRGATGAPVLLALFALSLLLAGTFSTDPALGYPPGAPEIRTTHGAIHGVAGLLAFTLLPAACFVMAWHFASQGDGRWAAYSIAVGLIVLVFFFASGYSSQADMSGAWHNAPTGIFQRIAIIAGFTWISAVAWRFVGARETTG